MRVSYESQLQRVQEQMLADLEDKDRTMDRLRAELEKYKVGSVQQEVRAAAHHSPPPGWDHT